MSQNIIKLSINNDGTAIVTVDRPEVMNALNEEAWTELEKVIYHVNNDDSVNVCIFTGAGNKAFVAGADISALRKRSMVETLTGRSQDIFKQLDVCEKISIAAVNGLALGGGCELSLACDIRIASVNAKFGLPELNLGIIPGAGGTQRLARLVGLSKAKEIILTGKILNAQEAFNIGLVCKVVAIENLLDEALNLSKAIMGKGPLALRLAKKLLNMSVSTDINAGLMLELLAQTILFGSKDRFEGIDAFLEKRKPHFLNK